MKVYYKQVQLNPTTATDYTDLLNKPQINSVELLGNQDTEQIKVTWFGTQAEFDALGTYSPTTIYIIDDGIPAGQQNSYLDLSNKPSINGQVLTGNKLSSDLNIYNMDEVDNMLASLRSIKVVSAIPSAPLANTMYYVGPDSEGIYMVYLFDSMLNRIDLGESVQRLYTAGEGIRIDEDLNKIHVKFDDKTLEINSEGALTVIGADNTTAYMNGHLLDSESNSVNTDIIWHGTQAQYDAITTKNPNTVYFIEDGNAFLDCLYPIGSIYMSATLSTPAQVSAALGGGWVSWGSGRVPVGVNTSDTDFSTVGKTGGAKKHYHDYGIWYGRYYNNIQGLNNEYLYFYNNGTWNTGTTTSGGSVNVTRPGNTGSSNVETTKAIAHTTETSSLPPYITCYMYQRVS